MCDGEMKAEVTSIREADSNVMVEWSLLMIAEVLLTSCWNNLLSGDFCMRRRDFCICTLQTGFYNQV